MTDRTPQLPDRHPQMDLFICDIFDAVPKSDMASMAHPIFSLSTKTDHKPRKYMASDGVSYVEIKPNYSGLATIHDRDILIFAVSQLMAAINEGRPISKTITCKAIDLLKATNRPTGGESYIRLREALDRLQTTQIQTNIVTGEREIFESFTMINRYRVVKETRDGRMLDLEIELSDWVFNAINAHEVLTISRDYFRLRKPLERRLYEIGRKHCGYQPSWKIALKKLQEKCGSTSKPFEFRRLIKKITQDDAMHQHMPDYAVTIDDDDIVTFSNRGAIIAPKSDSTLPDLSPDTYHQARLVAPGWDVYELEKEWRGWIKNKPKDVDTAFIGFCRARFAKLGRPNQYSN